MLEALKFAQGALKVNTITPELEYYQLRKGTVIGYNGHMALSAPIDLDIEAKPKAVLFHKALAACEDVISIRLTETGRLSIKSGGFKALIPCTDAAIYEIEPQGEVYPGLPGLAEWCKKLLPLIAQDATRPWAMGMNFTNGLLEVTNNVIILQAWLNHPWPTFNIPRFAVAELARIKEDPISVQVAETSVTFHYEDGRWLRTQRLSVDWPVDTVATIFERAVGTLRPLPASLFEALSTIDPFVPPETTVVKFQEGALTTGAEDMGATIEVEGLPEGPAFSSKMLKLVNGLATHMAFDAYPQPCLFTGDSLRGVIVGMTNV
jgi:hypothetical protein